MKYTNFLAQNNQPTSQVLIAQSQPPSTSNNNTMGVTAFSLVFLIFVSGLAIWFLNSFLCICKPNEVVIISGRKRTNKQGKTVGYRVLTGGRGISIPIMETVKRINVTTMPIRIEVRQVYSKGGIPLNIQAIANVKVSSNPDIVGNAIERFLDRDRQEIIQVAQETLEGNLRGVVATLTPEQVNEDRLEFAKRITSYVSKDLQKLGLEIDTLKIQNVSDEIDYLNSLSRERIALIIRDAEIAESKAISEAEQKEAEWEEKAEVAKTQDKIVVLEKENELRKIKAKLEQTAKSEEEITIAAAKERRAKVEQKLQQVRAELERLRLEAEEVIPAEAEKEAQILKARGKAAIYEENAKASAQVNQMLSQVWTEIGGEASEIFLIQQLENILQEAVQIPNRLHFNQANVVDSGNGKSVSTLVKVYPEIVSQFLDSVKQTLGIDVIGNLTKQNNNQLPVNK